MPAIHSCIVQSNPDLATVKIATNLDLPTKKSRMTNFLLIKNLQNSNIPDLATYFRMTANVAKSRFDCTWSNFIKFVTQFMENHTNRIRPILTL